MQRQYSCGGGGQYLGELEGGQRDVRQGVGLGLVQAALQREEEQRPQRRRLPRWRGEVRVPLRCLPGARGQG